MNRELIGPVLIIVGVLLLALLFWWLGRRNDRKRWAKMTSEVAERRARDDANASELKRAKS